MQYAACIEDWFKKTGVPALKGLSIRCNVGFLGIDVHQACDCVPVQLSNCNARYVMFPELYLSQVIPVNWCTNRPSSPSVQLGVTPN